MALLMGLAQDDILFYNIIFKVQIHSKTRVNKLSNIYEITDRENLIRTDKQTGEKQATNKHKKQE